MPGRGERPRRPVITHAAETGGGLTRGPYAGEMAGDEHASEDAGRGTAAPQLHDLTPLADLSHGQSRAGPVRERRPVYVDLLPPCNAGCPAGENIQAWLAHATAGRHEQAWRQLVADNPFAAIHGRVCYHPCETVCNRAHLDSSVSIHSVERFLGDLACERGWMLEPPVTRTGKRVLVIGAGPSGLSAAYHLAVSATRSRSATRARCPAG